MSFKGFLQRTVYRVLVRTAALSCVPAVISSLVSLRYADTCIAQLQKVLLTTVYMSGVSVGIS